MHTRSRIDLVRADASFALATGIQSAYTRWSPPGSNPLDIGCDALGAPLHTLRGPSGGMALLATRNRWRLLRAHTARRVLCTLGATAH